MRANERRLALAACLLAPLSGAGQDLTLSHALRLNYASSDKRLSDGKHYYLGTLETKASAELAPKLRATAKVRAGSGGVRVPFAYLDFKSAAIDIRAGKQILAWGRTDALNPTDVVTPRDYTTLLPFDEDERHGVWGVRGNIYATETIVASLFYGWRSKPSTLPFASSPFERYVFETGEARKRQLGLRVSTSTEDFDFSVSAYRGASLLAQAEQFESSGDGSTLTRLRYPEIDMLGADFARNFGKYGVRIEGAAVRARQASELGLQPYRYLVAGADRTFWGDLNVNVQLFARWTGAAPLQAWSDAGSRRIETFNNLIFVQTRENTYGMTARVANLWLNQTLGAELFVQRYFGDGSMYLHPQVSYAITDHVKVTAGAVWYTGKEGTLFGVMKKNNGVFGELRYSF